MQSSTSATALSATSQKDSNSRLNVEAKSYHYHSFSVQYFYQGKQLLLTLFQVADYVSIMAIKVLVGVKVKGPFRHHLDLSQELHEMKKRLSGLFLVPKHNKKEGHCVRLLR